MVRIEKNESEKKFLERKKQDATPVPDPPLVNWVMGAWNRCGISKNIYSERGKISLDQMDKFIFGEN